ncbi:MAG: DUF1320 domain-containing protein [Bacteroidetes bacterium]|nr:DUF1320 domain-containing protein [Bacteroidota bacterium]
MIYISKEDLETDIWERFIDESTGHDDNIIDRAEGKAIDLCKTYLTLYNTGLVFDEISPIRNEVLVDIISKLTTYNLIRRNAARKVPSDAKENWEWAMKQLEKIQSGRITLDLPPVVLPDGKSNSMWGNNTNKDYYI